MSDLPSISFGENVHRPNKLVTRNTLEVLMGIRDGLWRNLVAQIRSLPTDSRERQLAKRSLPYCTWAGVFNRRVCNGIVHHSGQCGIDLDQLGEDGVVAVLQAARVDEYCLAAFRSVSGEGARLIFRIPPCSVENHAKAFEQVDEHVYQIYGRRADSTGKDIARASFISFDPDLWINLEAKVLPILFPDDTQRLKTVNRCVSLSPYAGTLAETWPRWYGRMFAKTAPQQNGIAKTHHSLLMLGMTLALHARRLKTPLSDQRINDAFDAWLREFARLDVSLRGRPEEYRHELIENIQGAQSKPWFEAAAEKWIRWTLHENFPHDGLPQEKILFAIRQHCAEAGKNEFFLGARDAAIVAGVSKDTSSRALRKLCKAGLLEKKDVKRRARDAQTYKVCPLIPK